MNDSRMHDGYDLLMADIFGSKSMMIGGVVLSPALADFRLTQGDGLKTTVDRILDELPGTRMKRIIKLRYGLDGSKSASLSDVGKQLGVTAVRIRQIQAITLRMMRRPSIGKYLKGYLYKPTHLDGRVILARLDLYGKLREIYPHTVAFTVAKQVKRDDLRAAFKSTEAALKSSCGFKISYCINCGTPLPPGWTLCNASCKKEWNKITLVCHRCGGEFRRRKSGFINLTSGRVVQKSYCCRACMRQTEGDGDQCSTCGRKRTRRATLPEP